MTHEAPKERNNLKTLMELAVLMFILSSLFLFVGCSTRRQHARNQADPNKPKPITPGIDYYYPRYPNK